ncbi:hypothetical protein ACOME3_009010 [Neoechinorhynchus agilis]
MDAAGWLRIYTRYVKLSWKTGGAVVGTGDSSSSFLTAYYYIRACTGTFQLEIRERDRLASRELEKTRSQSSVPSTLNIDWSSPKTDSLFQWRSSKPDSTATDYASRVRVMTAVTSTIDHHKQRHYPTIISALAPRDAGGGAFFGNSRGDNSTTIDESRRSPSHPEKRNIHEVNNNTEPAYQFEADKAFLSKECGEHTYFFTQSPYSNGLDSNSSNNAFDSSFDQNSFFVRSNDTFDIPKHTSQSSPKVDLQSGNQSPEQPDTSDASQYEELNTRELAQRISLELKRYSIPQAVFAEQILSRSQGTLSDLLRNPKPWSKLKSGRETFKRMWRWLQEPEVTRMGHLCSIATRRKDKRQYSFNKLDELHETEVECSAKNVAAHRRPRLVFTDIQRRTLHAIFKETKRPSREMQVTIAHQLGLEVSTVSNFFMNARRRSMDKWQDNNKNSTDASYSFQCYSQLASDRVQENDVMLNTLCFLSDHESDSTHVPTVTRDEKNAKSVASLSSTPTDLSIEDEYCCTNGKTIPPSQNYHRSTNSSSSSQISTHNLFSSLAYFANGNMNIKSEYHDSIEESVNAVDAHDERLHESTYGLGSAAAAAAGFDEKTTTTASTNEYIIEQQQQDDEIKPINIILKYAHELMR